MLTPADSRETSSIIRVVPGFLLCASIGGVAAAAAMWMGSGVVWALLMAMVLASIWQPPAMFTPGIAVAGKHVLRLGVALLGFQISAATLHVIDWTTLAILALSIALVLTAGWLLGPVLGLNRDLSLIAAASVAICGASAAAAFATILTRDDNAKCDAACTIGAVSVISMLAMLAYPMLSQILDLDASQAGVLLGGSIHEVAHAVAAGYAVDPATGEAATVTKLIRVAMLAPATMLIAFIGVSPARSAEARTPALPLFLVAFIIFALLAMSGVVPPSIERATVPLSRFCLLMAMAAIGLTLPWRNVLAYGWRPIVLLLVLSAFLLTIVAAYVSRMPL